MLNKILILYILFLNLSLSINAQDNFNKIHPDILNTKWSAKWIFNPDASKEKYDVWNFRKTFELAAKPSTFIIHVSADNRYKLYVNEALVSLGPARNDANNWNFETVDIAPFLNEGENVVAALVWNFGPDAPIAEMNGNPAFILQGNTEKERILDSDTSWKVITNKAYSPIKTDLLTYYVVGPGEKVDFNQYPHGWKKINLNTSGWKSAGQIHPGLPKHYWEPWLQGKSLQPRPIPAMEYKPERIKKLRIAEGVKVPAGFPESQGVSLEIPSQKKVTLILDQTFLTNGYPVLKFSKGKNTIIRIKYAESLYMPDKTKSGAEQSKGNRNDVEGKVFVGAYDEIISDGGENRVFESLWWRTWRYIELSIETKDTPLVINDFMEFIQLTHLN